MWGGWWTLTGSAGPLPPCRGQPVSAPGAGRGERGRGVALRGAAAASPVPVAPTPPRGAAGHPGRVWPAACRGPPAPGLSLGSGSRAAMGEGRRGKRLPRRGGWGLAGQPRLVSPGEGSWGCGQPAAGETKGPLPVASPERGAGSAVPGSRLPAPSAGRECLLVGRLRARCSGVLRNARIPTRLSGTSAGRDASGGSNSYNC